MSCSAGECIDYSSYCYLAAGPLVDWARMVVHRVVRSWVGKAGTAEMVDTVDTVDREETVDTVAQLDCLRSHSSLPALLSPGNE